MQTKFLTKHVPRSAAAPQQQELSSLHLSSRQKPQAVPQESSSAFRKQPNSETRLKLAAGATELLSQQTKLGQRCRQQDP